ncbi:MAG: hypothetical protein KDC10_04090 [Calditrichaeota bacterium]|nr:hypothetical protein [Candidatus Cloacimonadota bacterium]MCA9785545.1 hypothetical protein [Candidatus Cloacimonadota bacterium]MCB1046361.1 hypothetical protein [Calditrichota bacterium]MCB9474313.1 hypothetical protein [Candidatus Delongbacteria bacterium]
MSNRVRLWSWGILIIACVPMLGIVDWLTGYEFNFFVFYFLPVSLAAWIFGWAGSVGIAVLCALVWFGADLSSGHVFQNTALAVWNTMIRLVSFMAIGSALAHIRTLLNRERRITEALRRSLSEIKVLEAFLPICAQCKSIRDKEGQWQPLESYIGAHANTQFSHGYCPECARKAMDEAFGTRPDV